jgi:hypothetical protein
MRCLALLALLLVGCSTAPIADLLDHFAPGRVEAGKAAPYGGVCQPQQLVPPQAPAALPGPPPPSGAVIPGPPVIAPGPPVVAPGPQPVPLPPPDFGVPPTSGPG